MSSPEPFDLDRELREMNAGSEAASLAADDGNYIGVLEGNNRVRAATAAIRTHVSHLEELVALKHPNDLRARNEKLAANNNALNARATKAEARVSHLEAENAALRAQLTSPEQ